MSIQGNDGFLDLENASLRVTGNVHAEGLKVGSVRLQSAATLQSTTVSGNTTTQMVQFTNPTKGFDVTSNIEVGDANLYVDTTTGRVGVGTNAPMGTLDVVGNVAISSNLEVGDANLFVDTTTGRVGIGTTSPVYPLDVKKSAGDIEIRLKPGSDAQGNESGIRFDATFEGSTDDGSRRAADLRVGYNGGTWGNEYMSFRVGTGGQNDVQNLTTERMRISGNGYVGIGTTNPLAPLDIPFSNYGTIDVDDGGDGRYLTWNGLNTLNNQIDGSVAINADGGGVVAHTFYAGYSIQFLSDRRIKKDIKEIDDESALQKFRLLKPSKYKYIEPMLSGRTDKEVYGFIAQEVAEVLPEGVSNDGTGSEGTNQGHIPNIMSMCRIESQSISSDAYEILNTEQKSDYIKTNNTYTRHVATITKTIDPSTFNVNSSTATYEITEQTKTTGAFDKNSDGKYHPLIFYSKDLKTIRVDVVRVIDDSSFVVDTNFLNVDKFKDDELLLYGQKPDDFYRLNKDAIFTLAAAALQEVDRQLQAEKIKVTTLETQVADLLARVQTLESA
tara:strand:+ start:2447 stop:4114 length:1668 start_codon:yes stop_codon:yes gene_type:complete